MGFSYGVVLLIVSQAALDAVFSPKEHVIIFGQYFSM